MNIFASFQKAHGVKNVCAVRKVKKHVGVRLVENQYSLVLRRGDRIQAQPELRE